MNPDKWFVCQIIMAESKGNRLNRVCNSLDGKILRYISADDDF